MFENVLRVDQDVVQVRSAEVVQVVKQHFVHVPLIRSRAICQAKWEHLILVRTIARLKRRELFRISVYANSVKSLTNIKLCKDLSVSDSGERFVNQGKQVLIFFREAIELTIVYTEAQAAVRLGDEEHRRGEGRAARHNKAFVKVF
jgi:hypothetical protein